MFKSKLLQKSQWNLELQDLHSDLIGQLINSLVAVSQDLATVALTSLVIIDRHYNEIILYSNKDQIVIHLDNSSKFKVSCVFPNAALTIVSHSYLVIEIF